MRAVLADDAGVVGRVGREAVHVQRLRADAGEGQRDRAEDLGEVARRRELQLGRDGVRAGAHAGAGGDERGVGVGDVQDRDPEDGALLGEVVRLPPLEVGDRDAVRAGDAGEPERDERRVRRAGDHVLRRGGVARGRVRDDSGGRPPVGVVAAVSGAEEGREVGGPLGDAGERGGHDEVGARRDDAVDRHERGLRIDAPQQREVARVDGLGPRASVLERVGREGRNAVRVPAEADRAAVRARAAAAVAEAELDIVPAGRIRGEGRRDEAVPRVVLHDLGAVDRDVAGVVDVLAEPVGRAGVHVHLPDVAEGRVAAPGVAFPVEGVRGGAAGRGHDRAGGVRRGRMREDVGRAVHRAAELRLDQARRVDLERREGRLARGAELGVDDIGREPPVVDDAEPDEVFGLVVEAGDLEGDRRAGLGVGLRRGAGDRRERRVLRRLEPDLGPRGAVAERGDGPAAGDLRAAGADERVGTGGRGGRDRQGEDLRDGRAADLVRRPDAEPVGRVRGESGGDDRVGADRRGGVVRVVEREGGGVEAVGRRRDLEREIRLGGADAERAQVGRGGHAGRTGGEGDEGDERIDRERRRLGPLREERRDAGRALDVEPQRLGADRAGEREGLRRGPGSDRSDRGDMVPGGCRGGSAVKLAVAGVDRRGGGQVRERDSELEVGPVLRDVDGIDRRERRGPRHAEERHVARIRQLLPDVGVLVARAWRPGRVVLEREAAVHDVLAAGPVPDPGVERHPARGRRGVARGDRGTGVVAGVVPLVDDGLAVDHERLAVVEPAVELVGLPRLDEHLALVGVDVVVVPAPLFSADRIRLECGPLAGAGVHEDAGRAVEVLGVRDGDEVRRQDGRGVVRGVPGDGEAVGGRRLELRLPQSGEMHDVRRRGQREGEEEGREDSFHGVCFRWKRLKGTPRLRGRSRPASG